jgi:hypothetical protein
MRNLEDREYSEDFVLLIAHSVSIHFLSSILASMLLRPTCFLPVFPRGRPLLQEGAHPLNHVFSPGEVTQIKLLRVI